MWRWSRARQARSGSKWIGAMPAAWAPATSLASVSPTCTTSEARMPSAGERDLEDARVGLGRADDV